eukprot:6191698-Pleurochrysis_carterae.AAC.4
MPSAAVPKVPMRRHAAAWKRGGQKSGSASKRSKFHGVCSSCQGNRQPISERLHITSRWTG